MHRCHLDNVSNVLSDYLEHLDFKQVRRMCIAGLWRLLEAGTIRLEGASMIRGTTMNQSLRIRRSICCKLVHIADQLVSAQSNHRVRNPFVPLAFAVTVSESSVTTKFPVSKRRQLS